MSSATATRRPVSFPDIASARQRVLRRRFNDALAAGYAELRAAPSARAAMRLCRRLTKRFEELGADGALWAASRMLRYRVFGTEHALVILDALCSLRPRDTELFFKRLHRSFGALQQRDDPLSRTSFVDVLRALEVLVCRYGVPWSTLERWRRAHWPKFVAILETLEMPTGGRESALQGGLPSLGKRR